MRIIYFYKNLQVLFVKLLMPCYFPPALKKFSNWPTYPQLYVKGELIGGLDILRELSESGELNGILND